MFKYNVGDTVSATREGETWVSKITGLIESVYIRRNSTGSQRGYALTVGLPSDNGKNVVFESEINGYAPQFEVGDKVIVQSDDQKPFSATLVRAKGSRMHRRWTVDDGLLHDVGPSDIVGFSCKPGDTVLSWDDLGTFETTLVSWNDQHPWFYRAGGYWVTTGTRGNASFDVVDVDKILKVTLPAGKFKPGDRVRNPEFGYEATITSVKTDPIYSVKAGSTPYNHVNDSGGLGWDWDDYLELMEPASTDDDPINPRHYKSHPSGMECHDITKFLSFDLGSAVKYLWRAGVKTSDKVEDLKKALWYVNAIDNPKSQFMWGSHNGLTAALVRFGQHVSTPQDGIIFGLVSGALSTTLPTDEIKDRIANLIEDE